MTKEQLSEMGRQLAKRRNKVLSPERRLEIAKFAASHPRPNRKKKEIVKI
jgi:hypothetical protein